VVGWFTLFALPQNGPRWTKVYNNNDRIALPGLMGGEYDGTTEYVLSSVKLASPPKRIWFVHVVAVIIVIIVMMSIMILMMMMMMMVIVAQCTFDVSRRSGTGRVNYFIIIILYLYPTFMININDMSSSSSLLSEQYALQPHTMYGTMLHGILSLHIYGSIGDMPVAIVSR
jgi:uncharacterized membrane protein YgcG